MYLNKLLIKNINNIEQVIISAPFDDSNNPKPLVFVGKNGAGKTVLLSFIVDSMYEFANRLFMDILPAQGAGYQYYRVVQNNNPDSVVAMEFKYNNDKSCYYLHKIGGQVDGIIKIEFPNFNIPINATQQKFVSDEIINHDKELLQQIFKQYSFIYLPAYRFEVPGWKNINIGKESLSENTIFTNNLGKNFEIINSLKENKKFILDFVLDLEINKIINPINNQISSHPIEVEKLNTLNQIIRIIKNKDNIRFGVNTRHSSNRISLIETDERGQFTKQYLHSLNDLSLGETAILNIFVNILRYADMFGSPMKEIKGIVIIDEIEAHLHIGLQHDALPKLIKLFPKVQFIVTTHSPLFLLGMDKEFPNGGYEIRDMPSGNIIYSERFAEFETAYEYYRETKLFENEIATIIKNGKPMIFVEGDYDIKYIKKAATLLGKEDLINTCELQDGTGFGNLDKIYRALKDIKSNIKSLIKNGKILLLYDCDVEKQDATINDTIFKRVISPQLESPIKKGIENLFSLDTIKRVILADSTLVDKVSAHQEWIKGIETTIPESFKTHPDKKKSLCDWICANGTKEDFSNFQAIFEIIETTILSKSSGN